MNDTVRVIIKDIGINDAYYPERKLFIGRTGSASDMIMSSGGFYGFTFVPDEAIVILDTEYKSFEIFKAYIEIID